MRESFAVGSVYMPTNPGKQKWNLALISMENLNPKRTFLLGDFNYVPSVLETTQGQRIHDLRPRCIDDLIASKTLDMGRYETNSRSYHCRGSPKLAIDLVLWNQWPGMPAATTKVDRGPDISDHWPVLTTFLCATRELFGFQSILSLPSSQVPSRSFPIPPLVKYGKEGPEAIPQQAALA